MYDTVYLSASPDVNTMRLFTRILAFVFFVIVSSRLFVVLSHDAGFPINPDLGVPGFPHCVRRSSQIDSADIAKAAKELSCFQRSSSKKNTIKIACVGDSITAGAYSSGGDHPYPQQLQLLLDAQYGNDTFSVTNLGACGSTLLKKGDSPFWERPQYDALVASKWDIVTIMLGTNDAKDPGSNGPNNWQHDCGGADRTSLRNCSYGKDYASMIELVRTLGTKANESPKIYAVIPPPLMKEVDSLGMNQTVINSVFPRLLPLIASANDVGLIDIYSAMGGETNWNRDPHFPLGTGCTIDSTWGPCKYWCDSQSCNQCHPNDVGYSYLAAALKGGLGL